MRRFFTTELILSLYQVLRRDANLMSDGTARKGLPDVGTDSSSDREAIETEDWPPRYGMV